jgi:hypothetical protein
MVVAICNDHAAIVNYLLSQGIKIRVTNFNIRLGPEPLPPDFFQIVGPFDPTSDYINIVIKHDSVGVWAYLVELGLYPDVSYLPGTIADNALKITEWLWQLHPDFDPNTVLGDNMEACSLDMLKWWAEPPRNWKPRSVKMLTYYINEREWDIVEWMLDHGCVPTEVDVIVIYGGITSLEWFEQRGLLPDHRAADLIIDDGTEYDFVDFEMLDWLAERNIYPTLNLEDISEFTSKDVMSDLRVWYTKWNIYE